MDVYAKAEAELSEIDSKIGALEKRRGELRQFIELGQKLFRDQLANEPVSLQIAQPRLGVGKSTTIRELSMKHRILTISARLIAERGPMHTRDLIPLIEAEGVEITGADKPTTVSVILSRSDDFRADRNVGWRLVNNPQKELTPQDAPTSAGSSTA